MEKFRAVGMAREAELDLVEVSPFADPPVCKIMDYGKWLYEEKRKHRESRKKSTLHNTSLKEIRLRPETDKHDMGIKVDHARKFLEKGHKVQFTMFFRGRQMLHQNKGYEIFTEIAESLDELAKIDRTAKMSHRRMTILFTPR